MIQVSTYKEWYKGSVSLRCSCQKLHYNLLQSSFYLQRRSQYWTFKIRTEWPYFLNADCLGCHFGWFCSGFQISSEHHSRIWAFGRHFVNFWSGIQMVFKCGINNWTNSHHMNTRLVGDLDFCCILSWWTENNFFFG